MVLMAMTMAGVRSDHSKSTAHSFLLIHTFDLAELFRLLFFFRLDLDILGRKKKR